MFVPVCDWPTVAAPTGTEGRHVMESESATIHRKMRAPSRQLPITGFAHKTAVVGDGGIGAVLAARDMATECRRAAALDRTHDLQLVEAHMAGIGATPCRPMVAEDIYCLLCQSLFGRYSRSNMIPSWSEWIDRAGEVPSGRPPWASLRFSSARRPDHRADPGKRAKRHENH
jgi:hypothetical protein